MKSESWWNRVCFLYGASETSDLFSVGGLRPLRSQVIASLPPMAPPRRGSAKRRGILRTCRAVEPAASFAAKWPASQGTHSVWPWNWLTLPRRGSLRVGPAKFCSLQKDQKARRSGMCAHSKNESAGPASQRAPFLSPRLPDKLCTQRCPPMTRSTFPEHTARSALLLDETVKTDSLIDQPVVGWVIPLAGYQVAWVMDTSSPFWEDQDSQPHGRGSLGSAVGSTLPGHQGVRPVRPVRSVEPGEQGDLAGEVSIDLDVRRTCRLSAEHSLHETSPVREVLHLEKALGMELPSGQLPVFQSR